MLLALVFHINGIRKIPVVWLNTQLFDSAMLWSFRISISQKNQIPILIKCYSNIVWMIFRFFDISIVCKFKIIELKNKLSSIRLADYSTFPQQIQ